MPTRILFDPRADLPDGTTTSSPVTVEATPTAIRESGAVVIFPTTLLFTISTAADILQLATPGVGQAWILTVRRGPSDLLQRTVTWTDAPTVTWAALTDLDPATLTPTTAPTDAWLAALANLLQLRATPPDPTVAVAYIDTSTVPPTLKGWNGTTWVAIGGGAATYPPLGLDTDGVPYFVTGAYAALDTDGVPYFTATPDSTSKAVLTDTDGVFYLAA